MVRRADASIVVLAATVALGGCTLGLGALTEPVPIPRPSASVVAPRTPGPLSTPTALKPTATPGAGLTPPPPDGSGQSATPDPNATPTPGPNATPRPPASTPPDAGPVPPPVLGYKDLGNGLPATQVYLGDLRGMGFMADGAPLLAARAFNRLWRLGPDGRLAAVAGSGTPKAEAFTDRPALEVGLAAPVMVVPDGQGGWLIGDQSSDFDAFVRLSRLDAKGRMTRLWQGTSADGPVKAAVPSAGGWTFFTSNGGPAKRWTVAPGQAAVAQKTYTSTTAQDGGAAAQAWSTGLDAQGVLRIGTVTQANRQVLRYDPATDAFTSEASVPNGTWDVAAVDLAGNRFVYRHAAATLTVDLAAGGPTRTVFTTLPAGLASTIQGNGPVHGAAAGPGDVVLTERDGVVFRHADGQTQVVAGFDPSTGGPAGGPIALPWVQSLALGPGGKLLVTERVARATYVRDGGGAFARDASLDGVAAIRVGAQGKVVVNAASGLEELKPDGARVALVPKASAFMVREFMVAADGAVYFVEVGTAGLQRYADGKVTTAAGATPRGEVLAFAPAPDGTIYALATQSVWRLRDGAWERVFDDQGVGAGLGEDGGSVVVDARGRVYVAARARNQVLRWDPATREKAVVAGPGGPIYAGAGVDDGLCRPTALALDANGDLLIADTGHQQVKRVPADRL